MGQQVAQLAERPVERPVEQQAEQQAEQLVGRQGEQTVLPEELRWKKGRRQQQQPGTRHITEATVATGRQHMSPYRACVGFLCFCLCRCKLALQLRDLGPVATHAYHQHKVVCHSAANSLT